MDLRQYLEREIRELQQEVPVNFAEQAAKGLEEFFARFVSAEHAANAIGAFEMTSTETGFEISLGTPLQFMLTGTGLYGPEQQGFVVSSPQNNILSWEQDGERRFASFVYNPGMEAKFSEEDIKDAIWDAIATEDE